MNWDDEEYAALKELWAQGKSATEVGLLLSQQFRRTITRNAVLGKVHRENDLQPRRSGDGTAKGRTRRSYQRPTPPGLKSAMRGIWANAPDRGQAPMPKDDDPHAHPDRKPLVALEENECRWPIGDPKDPAFGFCGHVKVAGLPYCEAHARRAYRPPAGAVYEPGQKIIPKLRKLKPLKLEEVL